MNHAHNSGGEHAEATREISEHPARPIPASLTQTDALTKLRNEQEKIVRELEAENERAQSIKGQSQR